MQLLKVIVAVAAAPDAVVVLDAVAVAVPEVDELSVHFEPRYLWKSPRSPEQLLQSLSDYGVQ